MKKCCVSSFVLFLLCVTVSAQKKSTYSFRVGATVSAGLSKIAQNNVGIGGLVGAEKRFSRIFAAEGEASYTYFTGDKESYEDGKNKAFAMPVMLGIKAYLIPQAYVSLRTGATWFVLNNMSSSAVRPGYGMAAGINLPPKTNRINVQAGYTSFRYAQVQRGYATLAASIIIN
jgi:Outer membrane protein beta-barrel domain